jgi:hypothetical protein
VSYLDTISGGQSILVKAYVIVSTISSPIIHVYKLLVISCSPQGLFKLHVKQ